ncbi:MAG: LysR family transcriptional regulator [Gammaproteobacteria bacterium]|uniref:LysR substrate-binding domain-containing protein n=1 Tax=Rhodoferax sp. TaxID=50421 RepID=UPI0018390C8D|nr:LysR substrate-binding domain-containing protein [Rhodoferax sp.]MBU3900134.1 LysR family transcriptional regulator [Gammaproteobacteria bacterium]MBA3059808.1 LysR family transcriptional regulator [Rhodoferax sp.]MBU3998761.1 LysR family transcriptional regulator [Gammaproteobacteria bacterium]MBU4018318.1 LysR family transcriptional regulator [Gammaproteobacteria bacterium]MBU4082172.1 LysR family transcriptional regulator [Gammaproteobacteria bacterium]
MKTPKPSLNALRAFEATARLRSFSDAANELSVTHGAVSRHVRSLEESLGIQLLNRNAHSTDTTPQGARLAEGLSSAFNLIQASIDQLMSGPITLSCSESIMMYWLIPRIARFHQAHPMVDLRFNMSSGPVDFSRENINIAIRLSTRDVPKDALKRDVVDEWIGPVCSAEYMQSVRIQSIEDLGRASLLATKTRSLAWSEWLSASGHANTGLQVADSFEHFYLMIQAAKCGLGVANVPKMLVRDDLSAGTLVAPFGFVPGPNKVSLWIAPYRGSRAEAVALEDWLVDELQKSEKSHHQ